jgi:hypothetical protein
VKKDHLKYQVSVNDYFKMDDEERQIAKKPIPADTELKETKKEKEDFGRMSDEELLFGQKKQSVKKVKKPKKTPTPPKESPTGGD